MSEYEPTCEVDALLQTLSRRMDRRLEWRGFFDRIMGWSMAGAIGAFPVVLAEQQLAQRFPEPTSELE